MNSDMSTTRIMYHAQHVTSVRYTAVQLRLQPGVPAYRAPPLLIVIQTSDYWTHAERRTTNNNLRTAQERSCSVSRTCESGDD